MKTVLTIFSAFICVFILNLESQAQSNIDILNMVIMQNDDKRDPPAGGLDPDGEPGSGGSNSKVKISSNWPISGKMISKNATYYWSSKNDEAKIPFTIELKKVSSEEVVFTAEVNTFSLEIPLSELNLKSGEEYSIMVSSSKFNSKVSKFTIVKAGEYKEVMKALKMDEDFKSQSEIKQSLLTAMALEESGFVYNAYEHYKIYVFDDQEDMVVRNLRDLYRKANKVDCLCN